MGQAGGHGERAEGETWVSSDDWTGRRVTVMGLGLFGGGLGAARFAISKGAQVTVTDQRDRDTLRRPVKELLSLDRGRALELVLGRHEEADFENADLVIVNPAVPKRAKLLGVARRAGTEITTAIELLLERLACRVVAVTGTNGKSSTVHFTAELLRRALPEGVRVALGGNIGGSLLEEAQTFKANDVVVLELSSYQLEHLSAPFLRRAEAHGVLEVAAITNIGVDHLARHKTLEAYRAAKLRLVQLAGPDGAVVLPVQQRQAAMFPGSRVIFHGFPVESEEPELMVNARGAITFGRELLGQGGELQVPGEFQRSNLAIALFMGQHLGGCPSAMREAIRELTGLPHRMESLGEFILPARPPARGAATLHVVDNGVSTTPESTVAALESLGPASGSRPRFMLVGGKAKLGSDVGALGHAALRYGWTLVPFGAAAPAIGAAAEAIGASCVQGPGETWAGDAAEATKAAVAAISGPKGESLSADLLFSPACASFDRYPNFQARAAAFRAALVALAAAPPGVQEGGRETERFESQD